MQNKELIINKSSQLFHVRNRKEYTKLTLNCNINPKLLFGFTNIKELTISSTRIEGSNYNEQNINSYPFIENLEKINFTNINFLGREYDPKKSTYYKPYIYYQINTPNLKTLNLTYLSKLYDGEFYIYSSYLDDCKNLEKIVIDAKDDIHINERILTPPSLKTLIIKFLDKEYIINFDYVSIGIKELRFDKLRKKIYIGYSNNSMKTNIEIDILTDTYIEEHTLIQLNDSLIKDNCLNIPDFITSINRESNKITFEIEGISLNSNILKKHTNTKETSNEFILTSYECYNLEKIIIRNNNEMSLFQNKEYNIKEYGEINKIYINNKKLVVDYEDFILEIDELSLNKIKKVKKINNKKLSKEKELELDKYTTEELIDYLYFKRFLKLIKTKINDTEINECLDIIKEKVIKKLTK